LNTPSYVYVSVLILETKINQLFYSGMKLVRCYLRYA